MHRHRHLRRHCRDLGARGGLEPGQGICRGKRQPGFSVEKIKAKIALRVVQNGLITLKECRVSEADRLRNFNSFKDTAKLLRMTRTPVA